MNANQYRYYLAAERARSSRPSLRSRLAGTAAAGLLLVVPMACGNGDEAVFAGAQNSTESATATAPAAVATTAPLTPNEATDATTAPTAPAATAITESAAEATATAAPAEAIAQELIVEFTYEPSSSGNAKRPYIAVWIEDGEGNLVDTISLWFQQDGKGTRWLDDLRAWHGLTGGDDTTMSSATRVPGSYTVAWDGTDLDGNPVAAGDYTLSIEAAREHGPYSFTSASIVVGDGAATISLADDGELSAATASLR